MKLNINKNITSHSTIKHGGINALNLNDSDIVDFSTNVNPMGCSTKVINHLKTFTTLFSSYPDPYSKQLYEKLSEYTGINKNRIVVGNGSIEVLYDFCRVFLNPQTPVLIPIPTFGEYESASKLQGCKLIFFKTMDLNKNLENFIKKIPNNGCIFICNPNNPTGILIKQKNMFKIIKTAQIKSSMILVDECFIELTCDEKKSVLKYIEHFDNLFLLRSLTKTFGLAGLRIGYGIGDKKIIKTLKKIKIPWSVNTLAQKAASLSLSDKLYLSKTRNLIKQEYIFLTKSISKINNFICYNSDTSFILIKSLLDTTFLQEQLLKHKILIRNCNNFRGLNNHFFRISIKTHNENLKLIKSLEVISRKH